MVCKKSKTMVTLLTMCKHPDSEIIDRLGGNRPVAEDCEITSQYVTKWRRTGIPSIYRRYLKLKYPAAFVDAQSDQRAA